MLAVHFKIVFCVIFRNGIVSVSSVVIAPKSWIQF